MGLFSRTIQRAPSDVVAAWRGRADDMTDAADHHWEVVMAALETEDRESAARIGGFTAALGLETLDLPSRGHDDMGGMRLAGVRHGRQVEIRIGLRERSWGGAAAMVTWLRAASADPHLDGGREGRILPALAPNRSVWGGIQVRGGAEGLVALRKMSTGVHSAGYLYDLWLLERIARSQGAAALPFSDLQRANVPYRMG